jgi:hypothetical protein
LRAAQGNQKIGYLGEMKNWLSIVIDGFNNELQAIGKENQTLDILRRKYSKAISAG